MKHLSPLRYPGGKACLTEFLTDIIDLNDLRDGEYFEPYAGGAGAALNLLSNGVVSAIHINDIDLRIYSFWVALLNETDRFIERIHSVPLTIEEWHKQSAVCENPKNSSLFDLGFSTFFMNRCNRSGVVVGAGPIGGLNQSGNWRLDVRFNRENLEQRAIRLSAIKEQIFISNVDAIEFLKTKLPAGKARRNVFVYLDPPYVEKGTRLYFNAYNAKDHAGIATYLNRQKTLNWLLSYDDTPLIRDLYGDLQINSMPIKYSLQSKRIASELIISPEHLVLPYATRHKLAV